MVSLSCLNQLQRIQQGSPIEGNWMREKNIVIVVAQLTLYDDIHASVHLCMSVSNLLEAKPAL